MTDDDPGDPADTDLAWRVRAIEIYVLALVGDRHNPECERSQAALLGREILDWLECLDEMRLRDCENTCDCRCHGLQ